MGKGRVEAFSDGVNRFGALPVAAYGVVLLTSGLSFVILTGMLVAHHGKISLLATSIRGDIKALRVIEPKDPHE